MLLKPIIDAFYFVKSSGIFSPAQIIGFVSFMLCIVFIIIHRKKQALKWPEILLLCFGFLLFLNAGLVYLLPFNLSGLGDFTRILLPVLFFFYLRNEIKSLDDVNGLLFTFLLSSIFPYAIYLYEFFFAPIRIEELSEGRGGGFRLTGIYADMFNYMAYIIGNFLIVLVYFTNQAFIQRKPAYIQFALISALTVIGLIGIKHQASWGVFLALLLLLLLFNIGGRYGKILLLVVGLGGLVAFPYIWRKAVAPLYAKEINAYQGKSEEDRALNGRIIRWKKYFQIWNQMPLEAQVFGVGFSDHRSRAIMMSGGMHSDYVRFLFSTGIFGILCYLLIFITLLFRSIAYPNPVRLYIISASLILLLYAISSNPFGASGSLLYLCLIGMILGTKAKSFFIAERT